MKRKTAIAAIVLLVVGGCAGKTIEQVYDYQGWEWQKDCQQNLRNLHTSMHIYASDYDDLYPAEDWANVIFPYAKNQRIYTCPTLYSPGTTNSGYSMNPAIYGKTQSDFPDLDLVVLFFESNSTTKGHTADPSTQITTSRHAGGIYRILLSGRVENLGGQP